MIERFVELAQKHAPELMAMPAAQGKVCAVRGYWFESWDDSEYRNIGAAQFTITLLEYLKGLAKPYQEWVGRNWGPTRVPRYLWASSRADDAMDRTWDTLTPEAVMQACIDVWEAME